MQLVLENLNLLNSFKELTLCYILLVVEGLSKYITCQICHYGVKHGFWNDNF